MIMTYLSGLLDFVCRITYDDFADGFNILL